MRHIPLNVLLTQFFASDKGKKAKTRLDRAQKKLDRMQVGNRIDHTRRNGPNKWKPIKDSLVGTLGKKCWYTEVELLGAPLAVDHYRPVCNYTWLAFDAENYRIACPWANSPEHNVTHGCRGGKGDSFPLLPPAVRATLKSELLNEQPIILDPCNRADCDLLAFDFDGRPILNPDYDGNAVALQRVEESKILLNLDHADFNAKRERLYTATNDDVRTHELLPVDSAERITIRNRIEARLAADAEFSTAARSYLQFHRHLDWVQEILNRA